jgi:elongation factor G
MTSELSHGPRAVAFIGPYQSGKTSLLESVLCHTGTAHRKATNGSRIFGDASAEAKAREMGTELNVATTEFMGDKYFLMDCPGSVEYLQEMIYVMPGVDVAVLVIEPDLTKIGAVAPYLKMLENLNVPRMIFVNKIDKASGVEGSVSALKDALQAISATPLVLRHLPVREGEQVTGYIDLAQERAYVYSRNEPSKVVELTDEDGRVEEARFALMETLADFDDHLMEELLEDVVPPKDEIFTDLAKDMAEGLVVPIFMGSAMNDNGVFRLLKALRHEAPGFLAAAERAGLDATGGFIAQALKTYHTAHGGKRTLVRVLRGEIADGSDVNGERISGITYMHGDEGEKRAKAVAGDLVAFARLEKVVTGDVLCAGGAGEMMPEPAHLPPVYELAIEVENRNDEVKLATSLARVHDEDPSISFEQMDDTHELLLKGQGEMHLRVAIDRLKNKYGLEVKSRKPRVPYKETIRAGKTQHSRYKKQSGGHGQFGDVVIDVAPLPAGSGFSFEQKIHGGSIPRQYIPSVETGVKAYLQKGPLGFPVVDVGVTLTDGKYHAVDSSDMAFQTAGRLAMSEALPDCKPVLLEPIMHVKIMVPSEFTAKVNSLISTRRGHILGFDARPGWSGWDQVEAHMPQSEMHDMIIELRSMTAGAGTYEQVYDHLSELTGRLADQVLEARAAD